MIQCSWMGVPKANRPEKVTERSSQKKALREGALVEGERLKERRKRREKERKFGLLHYETATHDDNLYWDLQA